MSHAGLVDLGRAWGARAMLRAGTGDVDGAVRDLVDMKKLARRLPDEGMVLGVLLGYVLDRMANAGVNGMAMSGKLSAAQCDALSKAIDMPAMPTIADALDTLERWRTISIVIALSSRGVEPLIGNDPQAQLSEPANILRSVDMSAMEWNAALKMINERRDAEIAAVKAPTVEGMNQGIAKLKGEREGWQKDFRAHKERLDRVKDESKEVYVARVTHGLMVSLLNSDLASREGDRRALELRGEMLPIFLAAAKVKAKTGAWPKVLAELEPAAIRQVPVDPYALKGEKVVYRLVDGKPRLLSVGPDREAETADDITVGDEPAPPPPTPTAAPLRAIPLDLP
jgi:hypothetical protein